MRVDSAVAKIPDRKMRRAVFLHYVRCLDQQSAADRMRTGKPAYQARLRIARWVLVGMLGDMLADTREPDRELHVAT